MGFVKKEPHVFMYSKTQVDCVGKYEIFSNFFKSRVCLKIK